MTQIVTLTDEERRKFVAYCRFTAHGAEQMARLQEEHLANLAAPLREQIVRRERNVAAAYAFVADHIDSYERMEVKGDG